MADIVKHIGFSNTGSKLAVVFPTIPGDTSFALVVEMEALPPKYADAFSDLVMLEAQSSASSLNELLSRRRFTGSTHQSMLDELHNFGFLQKVPVANVTMMVTRSQNMPLADIVAAMAGETEAEVVPQTNEVEGLSDVEQAKNLFVETPDVDKERKDLPEQG